MNNDVTKSNSKWAATVARQNAALDKVVTVRNTTILFWFTSAIIFLVVSYAPSTVTEIKWLGVFAKVAFKATIGLWVYADGRAKKFILEWHLEEWHKLYVGLAIIVPEIALPIYMVHSRGWVGAAKSTLRFAGYLLLAAVIWYGVVGVLEIFDIHEVGEPTIIFDRLHS